MVTGAQSDDCLANMASANTTLGGILTLPFGLGKDADASRSPLTLIGTLGSTGDDILGRLGHLQQAVQSMDLSITFPDHPAMGSLEPNSFSGKYSVSFPDVPTLIGLQLGVCAAALFGVVFATILYHTLLKNERKECALRRTMVGVPLLIASLFLPYELIAATGARNTMVRFSTCILFVLYQFRTLEAIFGFVPPGARSSPGAYRAYFSLPFDMIFDPKTNAPVSATRRDQRDSRVHLAKALASMAVLCSVLSPCGYRPFGEFGPGEFGEGVASGDYLSARHLGNCFAIAIFFQQGLALGFALMGTVIQTVFGYKAKQSMRNPMLEATSPSDFWGRRWNLLVHSVMKRGVYKPVRKHTSSATLASLAVFVASGLFHEWLVHIVFLHDRPSSPGVFLGSNTAFFLWNFVVIVCEKLLARTKRVQSLGRMMPSAFVPFVIIMTSLPVAHWFGNPYLKGGFFDDYEKCLFLIRKA